MREVKAYKDCPKFKNYIKCEKCKRFKVGGKRWFHCNGTDVNSKKQSSPRQTSMLRQLMATITTKQA